MCEKKENLILLISGVPGAGKTTISYELLKKMDYFRIVQETDILREIIRGYNDYLSQSMPNIYGNFEEPASHSELLSYDRAKKQCIIMKNSIDEIIKRQNRKCIPTIICGVHIIPEILYLFIREKDLRFSIAVWMKLPGKKIM